MLQFFFIALWTFYFIFSVPVEAYKERRMISFIMQKSEREREGDEKKVRKSWEEKILIFPTIKDPLGKL